MLCYSVTGEKPYQCGMCSRYFCDASVVQKHLVMVHKTSLDDVERFIVKTPQPVSQHYIPGGPGYRQRDVTRVKSCGTNDAVSSENESRADFSSVTNSVTLPGAVVTSGSRTYDVSPPCSREVDYGLERHIPLVPSFTHSNFPSSYTTQQVSNSSDFASENNTIMDLTGSNAMYSVTACQPMYTATAVSTNSQEMRLPDISTLQSSYSMQNPVHLSQPSRLDQFGLGYREQDSVPNNSQVQYL